MAKGTCSVEGCESPARKLGWCASHYSQQRRTGRPPEPFKRKWSERQPCVICGAPCTQRGRRRFCSSRCQMLESRSRRGENCEQTLTCAGCGEAFSVAATAGKRKPRSDARYCAICSRLRKLRVVVRVISVADARSLGDVCGICGEHIDLLLERDSRAPSIDHIVPVAFGGSDAIENMQITHRSCNQRKHLRESDDDYGLADRQRFYNLRRWRRLSAEVRVAEPRCRSCGADAVCVDHIVGIEEGGDPWDRSNLQALCRRCHNRKSQDEYRRRWSTDEYRVGDRVRLSGSVGAQPPAEHRP